mgnify:CR=1 FL=1
MTSLNDQRAVAIKVKLARKRNKAEADRSKLLKTLGVVGLSTAGGIGAAALTDKLLRKTTVNPKYGKYISRGIGAAVPVGALLALAATRKKEKW